jgi:hypothetical protein
MLERPPCHQRLRINQYWTKSFEEFFLKISRGRAAPQKDWNITWLLQNLREVLDSIPDVIKNDTALDWAVPLVKENLEKRRKGYTREEDSGLNAKELNPMQIQ